MPLLFSTVLKEQIEGETYAVSLSVRQLTATLLCVTTYPGSRSPSLLVKTSRLKVLELLLYRILEGREIGAETPGGC